MDSRPAPPPFLGVQSIVGMPGAVGAWRPTPARVAQQTCPERPEGAGPQFASMDAVGGWRDHRSSAYRPPLALDSPEYAANVNEVKSMGVYSDSGRSPDQSELALFWAGNTALYWNRIASQLSAGTRG